MECSRRRHYRWCGYMVLALRTVVRTALILYRSARSRPWPYTFVQTALNAFVRFFHEMMEQLFEVHSPRAPLEERGCRGVEKFAGHVHSRDGKMRFPLQYPGKHIIGCLRHASCHQVPQQQCPDDASRRCVQQDRVFLRRSFHAVSVSEPCF